MRRVVNSLILLAAGALLAVSTVETAWGQDDGDEVKMFDTDLGPASIDVSGYPPEFQSLYPLFARKCSKCHTLARPINSSKLGDEWLAYVSRMSRKPGSGISPRDAERVFEFLAYDSQARQRSATAVDPELLPFLEVSRELSGARQFPAANKNIPTEAEELRLRVRGDRRLNLNTLFESGSGQKLVRWSQRDPGRGELVLTSVDTRDGDAPDPPARSPADSAVRLAASEAIGTESDTEEQVELILDWLDEEIERTYQPGSATAAGVLEIREGDATEFTRLFCEMARSAGLPARSRIGLVARRTSFHFHAWAEVWLDGWVPIDPYLGQFPADITHVHLKAADGDAIDEWNPDRYPALDRLKIEAIIEDTSDTVEGG